jgi:hypothetical protein
MSEFRHPAVESARATRVNGINAIGAALDTRALGVEVVHVVQNAVRLAEGPVRGKDRQLAVQIPGAYFRPRICFAAS